MYNFREILRNVSWLQVASITTNASSAILGILVARYLGSHEFGLYSTAVVVATLFALFLDFGSAELMVREGSRSESEIRSFLGSALLVFAALFVVGYGGMALYAWCAGTPQEVVRLILIFGVGAFFSRGYPIWQGIFRIRQRLDIHAKLDVAAAFLRAILLTLFLYFRLGLMELVSIHASISVLFFGLNAIIALRFYQPTLSVHATLTRVRGALPFGISNALYFGYTQVGIFILSLMVLPRHVGAYAAAYRLIILCNEFPIIVFYKTLLPLMFRSYKENPQELREVYSTSAKYMLGLGLLISFFLFFYAKTIVHTLYGQSYEEGVPALQILAFSVGLRYLSTGMDATLTAIDRMRDKVLVQGTVVLCYVLLNLALIPRYSLYGAAVATLLSEAFLLALFFHRVRRHFAGLSLVKDLRLDRLGLAAFPLLLLAMIARGRFSDYLIVPLLMLSAPFLLRLTKFLDWQFTQGRIVLRHQAD